jgi:hypothetical protein
VGNLSSPGCSEINVMSLFNTIPRTKRSHGHKRIQYPYVKKSYKPRTLQDTFNDLLYNIQKPFGIHHIRTILFSLPVNYLKDFGLDKGGVDPFSPKYRLSSIICDVASFRLFKPVRSEPLHDNNRNFLHIPFANKGIDAINISNILNRKDVVKEIPPYFKNQSVPIVSYAIINFPNMCSNIPASPVYGVYLSQLIRYARASSNYSDFLKRHLYLRNRLLDLGYTKIRLIRSLKKFIFRYQDLVEINSVSAETIINDGFSHSENV